MVTFNLHTSDLLPQNETSKIKKARQAARLYFKRKHYETKIQKEIAGIERRFKKRTDRRFNFGLRRFIPSLFDPIFFNF